MRYLDGLTDSKAPPSQQDRRSDPPQEEPVGVKESRRHLSLTASTVLSMQHGYGNQAVGALLQRRRGLSAAPGAALMRACDEKSQDLDRAEAFSGETLFLRHGIGAHETNTLKKGAGLYSGKGMSAIGLSDTAFAVGPVTTDMGHFFYVYRFTKLDRASCSYSLKRGMSGLGWDLDELRKTLDSVEGKDEFSVSLSGLTPKGGGDVIAPQGAGGGGGGSAGTGGKPDTGGSADAAGAESIPVPEHRRTWIQAGRAAMAREIVAMYDSILDLKRERIESWGKNTGIEDPKPLRAALEIAIGIASSGMGGVMGRLISQSIASQLTQEFVKAAGKKATEVGLDAAAKAALSGSATIARTTAGDAKLKEDVDAALVSKGDLAACYVEANKLTAISDKTAAVTAFNLAEKGMTEEALADQVHIVTALYRTLQKDPSLFMRELTMGLMRLMDEMYIEKEAEDYEGDRKRLYKEDEDIDETDTRSGNLRMGSVGQYSIGKYYAPDIDGITGFRGAGTGEINDATLEELKGATVDQLPFSLTFRFWGDNPFQGLFAGDVFCKVWFVKRNDGTIVVDKDDADDDNGLEWLSSYYLNTSRELSEQERWDYSAKGARKLYEAIKDKPVLGASNWDLF
jgi:hypothetical protein